jgi:integrase
MAIYLMKGKKGRWRVRVRIDGVRKDQIVTGTKSDARKVEAQMIMDWEQPEKREVSNLNVPLFTSFCLNEYKSHAKNHLKSSTWRNRKYQIARLMEQFGRLRINGFTPQHIERFKTKRLADGVRPVAINDDLKVLRVILQYAIDLDFQVTIPRYKKLTERGQRRKPAWSAEQIGDLLTACAEVSPEILPMVVFLANTGCRKGEAIALRRDDINLESGVIHIQPSEDWTPKSNRPREVPVNDSVCPFLQPENLGRVHAFVCPRTGEGWAVWPERPWNRAVKKAGLSGGPHQLRHAYATHLVKQTGDLFLVQRILGHTHTRVTEIYAHLLTGEVNRAGRAVNFVAESVTAES